MLKMQREHIGNNEKWGTYESNVQMYRSNFISSQSFFLAVGAILLAKGTLLLVIILALIAAVNIWYIWFRIILSRIRIVDFHKFNMGKRFALKVGSSGEKEVVMTDDSENTDYLKIREKDYVGNRQIRKGINRLMTEKTEMREQWSASSDKGRFKNMRTTRLKIDVFIPISFSLVWLIFIGYSIYITYFN